jgi:hypothetical protein
MSVRRLERAEMAELRGRRGYLLRISGNAARLHRVSCPLVRAMNPERGKGIYYAESLDEALEWLEAKEIEGRACGICLTSLTYRPRPTRLAEHPQAIPS